MLQRESGEAGGTGRALRLAFVSFLAIGALLLCPRGASAEPIRIHVRGSAVVQAFAGAEGDRFSIKGEVADDAGVPLPNAALVVVPSGKEPLKVERFEACEGSSARKTKARRTGEEEFQIETDERGTFCVLGKTSLTKGTVKIRFPGSKNHDAAEIELVVEADLPHLFRTVLRYEPAPETIDLDRESVTITVSLRVDRADAARSSRAASAKREGIALTLEDEGGKRLGEAITGGDGRARFEVKTSSFGPPGTGELTVRFAGNSSLAKASATQSLVRRASVRLALSKPTDRADADEGATFEVDVTTARGPVASGVIEALRGTDSLGAAPVTAGKARVVAVFPPNAENPVPVRLRYVPATPWFQQGPELRVDVRLAGPGVFRQVSLAVVVAALAAWIIAGWRRSPKAKVAEGKEHTTHVPSGRPGVQVLAPASGFSGWKGVVTDAHDGLPVAGAQLRIVAPSFEGDGTIAKSSTDERGNFRLEGAHRNDARLVVESDIHSTYEQALPPPSVLGVALVTRRRTLLERLVRWARRTGSPFDSPPEPTPGHVRRVAARTNADEIALWAAKVESAAYGPDRVGASVEKDVRAAEPRSPR